MSTIETNVITIKVVSPTVTKTPSYTCFVGVCKYFPLLKKSICEAHAVTQETPCNGTTEFNTAVEACSGVTCP